LCVGQETLAWRILNSALGDDFNLSYCDFIYNTYIHHACGIFFYNGKLRFENSFEPRMPSDDSELKKQIIFY
jgi:hypothetical protein